MRSAKMAYLLLHSGHWMITIPWWYARFENMCDVRSSHSGTLHVKVRQHLGSSGCCVLAEFNVCCETCRVLGGALVAKLE